MNVADPPFTRAEYRAWLAMQPDSEISPWERTSETFIVPEFYTHWLRSQPDDVVLVYLGQKSSVFYHPALCEIDVRMRGLPNIVEDREGLFCGLCSFCGRGFYREDLLSVCRHFTEDGSCRSGFTPDRTCVCGETFDCLSRASKHRIQQNCLASRIRREAMKKARTEELKRLLCEPCGHQSYTAKEHTTHCGTKQHHRKTNPTEFDCAECSLHFEFKSELARHLTSKAHQPKEDPLRCDVCAVTFRCPAETARHMAGKQHLYKADPARRPTLTCTLCGITRPSHAQYRAHLQTAKHQAKVQAMSEDPSSPDDADASDSPDRQSPSPVHSPPLAC